MPHSTTLLLDRDGTVIKDKHYLADPEGVELLPGVGEALGLLGRRGMRFFLISNQSGVGRGFFAPEAVLACNARLAELLQPYGVYFSDVLFCPHAPEEHCTCRKPGTGMWDVLRTRHALAPETSLMIGDKPEDMAFAARAGLAGRILVLSGKGRATMETLKLHTVLERLDASGQALRLFPASEESPEAVIENFSFLPDAVAFFEE
mgnify:CR=1 FL=1